MKTLLCPLLLAACTLAGGATAASRSPKLPRWVTPPAAVDAALASAHCTKPPPGDPDGALPPERLCVGAVPLSVAAFLRALPADAFHLPRERLERSLSKPQQFTAIRGMGTRPDLMVWADDWEVRTLEGPDPHTTYFLITGPMGCDKEPNRAPYEPVSSCRWPYTDWRGYRMSGRTLTDVSRELTPDVPADTRAYQRYLALNGELQGPDPTRLSRVPVVRWFMTFDPEDPDPDTLPNTDPRVFGGENNAHLGFLVWDGRRWAPFNTVPRTYWPCLPVKPGARACTNYDDTHDRFVRP